MYQLNLTPANVLLKKNASHIKKLKLKFIALVATLIFCQNVSAHVFEIRYKQAPNGSITWYLISYHNIGECPAEQAGLTINGTNYPVSSVIAGDARALTPNIFVQDLGCYARVNPGFPPIPVENLYVSYAIVNTPFIGGALTVAPYSNAVCFAFCVGGTIVFNPPPVINCPANVSKNADNGVCSAVVTVPGPTVIDNCTYSGANPEMVINGNFSAGAANWDHCGNGVEAYCNETCYGGSNAANACAEIDHHFDLASFDDRTLCQTITGFIPGKIYQLKFKASRRVGSPLIPAIVGTIVMINGGAFSTTVLRTNTSFNLTDETFTFFATQPTHQLTFVPTPGWSGAYGFIVDDISIKKKMGTITNSYNNTGNASGSYPVGVTNVVWTIVDCSGNSHTCNQTVEVIDNQVPVITVSNLLSCFEAGNNGCNINLGATASDNCGIASLTSNAPSCFPVGTTTVTWTAMDVNGNSFTAAQIITRNPQIHVSVCASPTRTIYRGTVGGAGPFGPQVVNLTSTVSAGTPGYSYNWIPAAGLNDPTIANPVASPAATTTYVLTVTDSKGCTRSVSITINVLPLSSATCSNNANNLKFNVCHIPPGNPSNVHDICISVNALNAHLTSGSVGHQNCYLGECDQLCFTATDLPPINTLVDPGDQKEEIRSKSAEKIEVSKAEPVTSLSVTVSPNPTMGSFILEVRSIDLKTPVTIRVMNANGVVIESFRNLQIGNNLRFGNAYRGGNYYAEIIQGNNRKVVRLVKQN
jgi:hypothetical protein